MNSNATHASSVNLPGIASFRPRAVLASLLLSLWAGAAQAQSFRVVSVRPVSNARSAPRTTPVTARFSQTLNTATATQQAFKVFSQQAGGRKAGNIVSNTSNRDTISLLPTRPFKAGETVFATVTTAIRSNNDQPLDKPQVFQFTTAVARSAGVFVPGSDPTVGNAPADVAVGDIDGDGDLDLLTTSPSARAVSVRLNNGSGSFSGTQEVSIGSQPYGLTLGDVDSDGDLDLLTLASNLSSSTETLIVRLNNGASTFGAGSEVAVGGLGSRSIALADIDGDGDLDALTSGIIRTISVRLNNGAGVFSGSQEVSVDTAPYSVALGDVDNDGDIDLLAANLGASNVSIRLNNGAGVFSGTQNVALPLYTPNSVALGDVDGDGDLDFVATGTNPFGDGVASIQLNNGVGTFSISGLVSVGRSPQKVAIGDVDGDGDLDFTTVNGSSNTVSVRLNNGQGTFSGNAEVAVGNQPASLILADVDGNNTLDIITANAQASTASVRLNSQVLATKSAQKTGPLSLYPNPAHGSVRLQLPSGYSGQTGQVSLINALGQVVLQQPLSTAAAPELALPSLAPGIYTVQLNINQATLATRLVIE
ncbi:FG-GAP-like repeat-containing protein [Hymenobacter sp. GOD-10R]|uniref:FG-GAP-like repeat-containing protein n=1 Tax=Hymenobacter sp. GOD-10R TaxID=3093922 RepID=UPI002D79A5C4|nr:FG-GAP-like repeat-containing protein [Hymenobacter sp. GOD-10R]WRQ27645.1 FG-GAP-like repeat-containing protein [Hymenobacter sp. GOD-10R]